MQRKLPLRKWRENKSLKDYKDKLDADASAAAPVLDYVTEYTGKHAREPKTPPEDPEDDAPGDA